MRRRRGVIGLGLLILVSYLGAEAGDDNSGRSSPLSPAEEKKTFQLADPSLTIELVAAEPDVISPVAVAWDEACRMYVAEMSDYPVGPTSGRIKVLEDSDGDGKYEKATVFADNLPFPNGVLPSHGGVLVTAAPNIWYFRDTNGDGRADEKHIILTGFGEGNQQLRVNGLMYGLDNWIYGANGRSEGDIRRPDDPKEKAVSIRRRDFRFRLAPKLKDGKPEVVAIEAVAGFSQFGLAKDDWGNRFTSWNTVPMRHVVLEDRYLNRNPYLVGTNGVADILDPADPGRIYPISPRPKTFNREPVDYFNASCGLTIYRGHLLGDKYRGNAFVCEPLTNLVHRRVLVPSGPTFIAKREEQGKEFLASADPWFHPVNLTTGPDGALYICDFYREWVEHPAFVAENLRKDIDFRKGFGHGRIWRVSDRKAAAMNPRVKLHDVPASELAKKLDAPNGWVRDSAQRLLVERQDKESVAALKQMVRKATFVAGRVQALWTLGGLAVLDDDVLIPALRDSDARVKIEALRLTGENESDDVHVAATRCWNDPDARVRFQGILSLGSANAELGLEAFIRLAARDHGDEWLSRALLLVLEKPIFEPLTTLLAGHPAWLETPTHEQAVFLAQVAALIGAHPDKAEIGALMSFVTIQDPKRFLRGQIVLLAGLAEGLARSGKPLAVLFANPPVKTRFPSVEAVREVLRHASELAGSSGESSWLRAMAVRVAAQGRIKNPEKWLMPLLQAHQPADVQLAAARGVGDWGNAKLAAQALKSWGSYQTGTRRELLASLLRSPALAGNVLEAIEEDTIAIAELDAGAREALLRVPNAELQGRVKKLIVQSSPADRQEILRKYQAALQQPADAKRGGELFAKNCAVCHHFQGQGHRVGPELSGIGSRPKETLLLDILDPNKEVSGDFTAFIVVTQRGEVLTGLLAAETATGVRLRRAEDAEDNVLRTEIQELRATGKSLMPEGLEQTITVQDMADLLEYLQRPPQAK